MHGTCIEIIDLTSLIISNSLILAIKGWFLLVHVLMTQGSRGDVGFLVLKLGAVWN